MSTRISSGVKNIAPVVGPVMSNSSPGFKVCVDMKPVDETVKGESFSIKTPEKIRPNDQLYKMVTAVRRGTAHER